MKVRGRRSARIGLATVGMGMLIGGSVVSSLADVAPVEPLTQVPQAKPLKADFGSEVVDHTPDPEWRSKLRAADEQNPNMRVCDQPDGTVVVHHVTPVPPELLKPGQQVEVGPSDCATKP